MRAPRQATCRTTFPIETTTYELAAAIKGWSFGIDPSQEMTGGACDG